MPARSKLRVDADNTSLKVQNRLSVQARITSETKLLEQTRDAKTAMLKAQRLEKEAMDRAMTVRPQKGARS